MKEEWAALARQIAHGTGVVSGSKVSIFLTDVQGMPAAGAFVEEVYRRGGVPQVLLSDETFDHSAVKFAPAETLRSPAPLEAASMEWADVHVSFRAMKAPVEGNIDEQRLALQRIGKGSVSTLRWQKTRWAIVRLPTKDWAELIECPYEQLMKEFFAGCIADWQDMRSSWSMLATELEENDYARITSHDTDLRLNIQGRTWIVFAGEANLPDGELATAPIEDGVDGFITFPGRFWFAGSKIADLQLTFEHGDVVDVRASQGEELAKTLLATDEGSHRVGELGIGLNPAVQTVTGDLLIDEKILGTVHIALGRAYPECGGHNQSSLHWDIVKDLRGTKGMTGGTLNVGGQFLIHEGNISKELAHPQT